MIVSEAGQEDLPYGSEVSGSPLSAFAVSLPLACYRLRFETSGGAEIRGYTGSAWRGALGFALKKLACLAEPPCGGRCLQKHDCAYSYLFETPPPEETGKMRKYKDVPRPYVLVPQESFDTRFPLRVSGYDLSLTLIGRANDYLAYMVNALDLAAQTGLSHGLGALKLVEVLQERAPGGGAWERISSSDGALTPFLPQTPVIAALPERASIELITPFWPSGADRKLREPTAIDFTELFSRVLRRISMLTYFHTDTPLETDFSGLTAKSREAKVIERKLRWEKCGHYSSRRKRTEDMSGWVGTLTLANDGLEAFWPYLWLGQWTHVGEGAVKGLGRYRIEVA